MINENELGLKIEVIITGINRLRHSADSIGCGANCHQGHREGFGRLRQRRTRGHVYLCVEGET